MTRDPCADRRRSTPTRSADHDPLYSPWAVGAAPGPVGGPLGASHLSPNNRRIISHLIFAREKTLKINAPEFVQN
jgi:hypothetical protein